MSYTQHQQTKTKYKGLIIGCVVALSILGLVAPKLLWIVLVFPFVAVAAMVIGISMALLLGGADVFMAFFGHIFRNR